MTALTFHPVKRCSRRAFTLVEVILAIVIALGILVVLLYFYQQATHLRSQAIQETERIAAARLIMDRMTGELGALQAEVSLGPTFLGTSNSLEFVKADVPSFASWMGGGLGRSAFPVTDLKVVRYRLHSVDGTNVAGLLRSEEPMILKRGMTGTDDTEQTNTLSDAASLPILPEIRWLQFRYWSGTNWMDSWTWPGTPGGIEVSLGAEPATNETEFAALREEIFRRVIYLAGNAPMGSPPASSSTESGDPPSGDAP